MGDMVREITGGRKEQLSKRLREMDRARADKRFNDAHEDLWEYVSEITGIPISSLWGENWTVSRLSDGRLFVYNRRSGFDLEEYLENLDVQPNIKLNLWYPLGE